MPNTWGEITLDDKRKFELVKQALKDKQQLYLYGMLITDIFVESSQDVDGTDLGELFKVSYINTKGTLIEKEPIHVSELRKLYGQMGEVE